jgi:hypothetical protein
VADPPDEPFNDGFDICEPRSWLKWREWAAFQPHELSVRLRRFSWVMLFLWAVLLVFALIHPKDWQLPEAILFVMATVAILARDWVGRRRREQRG